MSARRGRISRSSLDELLQAVPLSELIGQSVSLKQQSGRWIGLCPFHSESSPSFYVFDDHYHCFGCQAHGKAIDFEMHRTGATFPDAAVSLASRFGVTLQFEGGQASAAEEERYRKRLTQGAILDEIAAFYQRCLNHSTGKSALSYLTSERLFTAETLARFGLGYAPAKSTLQTLASRKHWPLEALQELGLIRSDSAKGSTRMFDFMRDRIVVPIHDDRGSLVGFGGRIMPQPEGSTADHKTFGPKYLNSPESDLFSKSSLLFNFHRARRDIIRKRWAVVVEGYMDVVTMVQAGFENVVGVLGTALTQEHMQLLSRCADHVILCFDADQAGQKALLRTFEKVWPLHLVRISAVRLPAPSKDPDEFLRTHPPEALAQILDEARPLLQVAMAAVIHGLTYREERILAVQQKILPIVQSCQQDGLRSMALNDLADALGLDNPRWLTRGEQQRRGPGAWNRPPSKTTTPPETATTWNEDAGSASSASDAPAQVPSAVLGKEPVWTVGSAAELRLLVLLLHASWGDLPKTLVAVYTGQTGDDVTATLVTLRTLQTVVTPGALIALDHLVLRLYEGSDGLLCLAPHGEPPLLARALLAVQSQDADALEHLGVSPRALARPDVSSGRFHPGISILAPENLSFVKFLFRDVALAKNQSTISSQISKILIGFEVTYLDRELALWSMSEEGAHGADVERNQRYRRVLEERAKRLLTRNLGDKNAEQS